LVDRGRSLQKNSHTLICSWRSEMKARRTITATLVVLMAASLAWAKEPPVMKMTTEIPPGIATPDRLKTRIGTLNLFDGIPDEACRSPRYPGCGLPILSSAQPIQPCFFSRI